MNSDLSAIKPKEPRLIGGSTSVFLDSLRILATAIVIYGHAYDMWFFPVGWHPYTLLNNATHAAVIVFFVLSGFVISFSTTRNNRGGSQYAQARLSRLCSVVLPALLVTACAEIILKNVDPILTAHYANRGVWWQRYVITGAFSNEIWFFSSAPPTNGPLWSLSFEFWYYVIFGCWLYKGKGVAAYLIPIAACLIAGPKILAMMPIWIAGCIAYSVSPPKLKESTAWILVTILLAIALIGILYLPFMPFNLGKAPLFYASQFITDWIIGLFIALAFWIVPIGSKSTLKSAWVVNIRKVADVTFPIYVLHNPLLILWRGLFHYQVGNALQMWEALLCILLISVVIGVIMERQRPAWIRLFKYIFSFGAKSSPGKVI